MESLVLRSKKSQEWLSTTVKGLLGLAVRSKLDTPTLADRVRLKSLLEIGLGIA